MENGYSGTSPAEQEQTARLRALAQRLAQIRRAGVSTAPWYMVNIGHPAVMPLYEAWLRGRRGQEPALAYGPPGDAARLEFELGLLSEETLRRLERWAAKATARK